jgi:hypothetical protein
MTGLQVKFLHLEFSVSGSQADLVLTEQNGDEYRLPCLCKEDGTTEICEESNGEALNHLKQRYGSSDIWQLCRDATLSGK